MTAKPQYAVLPPLRAIPAVFFAGVKPELRHAADWGKSRNEPRGSSAKGARWHGSGSPGSVKTSS
jgi:hypothetical protein